MKFNYSVRSALAVIAVALLTSCGGGGAKTNPDQGGTLILLPAAPTFYAGVAYTMTISGGRAPYSLTSDQPQVLSVPALVNGNTFQVVANNPGVIDTGLPVGSLPIRTVNITAKDSTGQGPVSSAVKVGQNFLTSYTLSFPSTSCSLPAGTTTITPCAGGDTVAEISAIVAGNLIGDKTFQLDIVTGTMSFVNPIGSNTLTQSYTATSDHQGNVFAVIRVPSTAPSQIGMIRVTDVASGVSNVFAFQMIPAPSSPLAVIPATFTFTGTGANCGNGSGDFFVTGGVPPYRAASSDASVSVIARDATAGHFTVSYFNASPPCVTGATVVVTDSGGSAPATVTVTSTPGTPTPPTPLTAAPAAITLGCGLTSTVTVVGGSGAYSASATSGLISTAVSGNTVGVTLAPTYPAGSLAGTQDVVVTDGSTLVTIPVTVPNACP